MKRKFGFYLREAALAHQWSLTDAYFLHSIQENNDEFDLSYDEEQFMVVVECENKPRDLPSNGIIWKEIFVQ